MRKKKKKHYVLKKPSLLRRVWKVWVYNIFWLALFTWLFWGNYSIDELCEQLDLFLSSLLLYVRKDFFVMLLAFWFWFRQVFKVANLIKYTILTSKHDKDVIENGGSKRCYEAVEGTGKTLNVANDVLLLACDQQKKHDVKYYLLCPFEEELGNNDDFKAIKSSYEYFEVNKKFIPHLMANFPLEYKGRNAFQFEMAYIDQEKRLAEGFAIGLSEIANVLPNAWSKVPADEEKDVNKLRVKNEFLSLSRQYTATKIVADEQRTGEIYLGFRSVISSNKYLEERVDILTPHFLVWIYNRLIKRVRKKRERTSKFLSRTVRFFENIIQDIGFYKFIYSDKEAIKDNVKEEKLSFVLSKDLPFKFDTRGMRKNYRLYKQKPDESKAA